MGSAQRVSVLGRDSARHDALDSIVAHNAIQVPELLPIRHGRMMASPWNYYRGAAAVMADDLASRPHSGLLVQLCGDAYVLSFGLWATPEQNLMFDLIDPARFIRESSCIFHTRILEELLHPVG